MKKMYGEKAIVQRLLLNIKKREELMAEFRRVNSIFMETTHKIKAMENITKLMENLRFITLVTIECAFQFRKELIALSQFKLNGNIPIMYNGMNYFQKIVKDTLYIHKSEISEYFKFPKAFDLFFLSISQPAPLILNLISQIKNAKHQIFINPMRNLRLLLSLPAGTYYKLI